MKDSKISPEVEFYKMIMLPEEDEPEYTLCEEFGWVHDEFLVWISYDQLQDFIEYFIKMFGCCGLDCCDCKADLGVSYVVIDMCKLLGDTVDIESVFPKDRYQH